MAVDRVLIYAKGGAAWTNVNSSITDSYSTAVVCGCFHLQRLRRYLERTRLCGGWRLKWAFAGNWTFKAEALYLGFNKTYAVCGATGAPGVGGFPAGLGLCGSQSLAGIATAKIGLNYKFDWGGPVVARY